MLYYCYKDISDTSEDSVQIMRAKIEHHFCDKSGLIKKESIYAKYVLCHMLEALYGLKDYKIKAEKEGKLYIENSDIFFNLSHSKQFVFCTVADEEVGCDVQFISECNMKIAKRFFTSDEHNLLLAEQMKDEAFFRLWTVKESILKHSGKGISAGLATYDFSDCCLKDCFEKYGLEFRIFIKDGYAFCFCSKEKESCLYELKMGGD